MLWQLPSLTLLKCFDSVYRPVTIRWIFSSTKLLITYLIPCASQPALKTAFTKIYCIITSNATVLPFFFPSEVAMATAVGSFCRLFFQVAALVHVSHYRYTASGKLSSTDVLSVSWASPRLPPCPIHWCILKNVMYVSNVTREGELAG